MGKLGLENQPSSFRCQFLEFVVTILTIIAHNFWLLKYVLLMFLSCEHQSTFAETNGDFVMSGH